jgi:nucleoid-associated protein YgaU
MPDPNLTQTPQAQTSIENVPVQKSYTDYEPIVTHENIPYQRKYNENVTSVLGTSLPVETTKTDY